jgi:hypothetical protein
MADAFANAFKTLETTPGGTNTQPTYLIPTDAGYDGVRVYSYNDATGKASFIADSPIGRPGRQTAGTNLPNQCCIVVTLKTGVAGRRNTGRIYVPLTKWNVGAGGQLASTDVTNIAGWWSALFTQLNSAASPAHVGVLSQKYGTYHSATALTCDTKVDIQRRRANRLAATSKATVTVT